MKAKDWAMLGEVVCIDAAAQRAICALRKYSLERRGAVNGGLG